MDAATYLLEKSAPADVAVIKGNEHLTYAALTDLAGRIGNSISEFNLEPGARVGLVGPNSPFWIASYLATIRLGLVAVPFPGTFTGPELERGSQWVEASLLLSERPVRGLPGIPSVTRSDLSDSGSCEWPDSDSIDPASDAVLLFTSGSTGRPRAVRITHGNIQANTDSIISYLELRRSDRMLVILPFAYSFGASLLHTHLRIGGSLVLANNFVYPERVLDTMAQESVTGLAGVPSSFHILLRNSSFKSRELPNLRIIQQAGGKLPAVLVAELVAAQPQARVFVMYGQTEATARLSYLPPELALRKPDSIGRGIPGVDLRVRGEDGELVQPGEIGEICARGGNVSPGYFRDPEATAAKFVDGELHTGDLAVVDSDGYISVVDRVADFIKSWGYRISSQEVEAGAMTCPELVAAAAVGVPDEEEGERVELFVVLAAGSSMTEKDVISHTRKHLAKHMVPSAVHFLPALPLNANGKVSKAALRGAAPGQGTQAVDKIHTGS